MIILTGSVPHPDSTTIAYPNAYIETCDVSIREERKKLIWSCLIWATKEDKEDGRTAIISDSGSIPYNSDVLVDIQLRDAMLAGTSKGSVDYSNTSAPT